MSHGVRECDIVTLQITFICFCNKRFCNKKGAVICAGPRVCFRKEFAYAIFTPVPELHQYLHEVHVTYLPYKI